MKTILEKNQKFLLKKFHALCTKAGLERYEKLAIIEAYGHSSSADMSAADLLDAIQKLEVQLNPELVQLDTWRKRVMASIGGWLKLIGHEQSADKIKAIACRSTGHKSFNEIPKERLINVYYAFLRKQKDFDKVDKIAKEEYDISSLVN